MKKVKSKFLNALFVLFCLGVVFASCSTDLVEKEDEEKIELTPESFKTNFSESGYHNALNNVTNVLMSTRSTQLSEEIVQKAIEPFVLDGKYLKEQILKDKSTDEEDEEKLDGLNDSQLAVLSLFANALIYDVDFGNDGAASTRAAVNKELLCLADALAGGGVVGGGLTWGAIIKIGGKTALKRAACALTGMVGGAIAAAMIVNDYNACMNG